MADEREKRREAAKLRAKKRRRRRTAFTLLFLLIVLLSVFAVLCCTVLFPVKNVTAKGSKIYSSAEIIKAAGMTEKDNVLAVNERKLEEKLRRKLPFVDSLQISRSLPDCIHLQITDAKETSAVEKDGVFYTLSQRGYVLQNYEECPENTFLLVLGEAEIKMGEMIVAKDASSVEQSGEIEKLLKGKKLKINKIDVSDPLNISLRVEDRFDVLLGNGENLENKVAHLAEMVENIGERKGEIDLSGWSHNNTQGIFKAEK